MKQNQLFLQSILDSHPGLMVFTLDRKYRYTYFSKVHQQVMESFWGKKISLGENMLRVISSESIRKSTKNSFDKALSGKSFVKVKRYPIDRDDWYIENHYAPTKDTKGRIIGVTVFAVDITNSQKIENEIEQSRSLLETTINSSVNGFLVVDKNGKAVLFNDRFLDMMGIPFELAKSKNDKVLLDFVLPKLKNAEAFLERVRYLYAHPKDESRDIVELKDGRIYARYSTPHKLKNKIIGRVWSFLDVTDQQNVEQELKFRENRYRTLQEASFGGIGLHEKGMIIDANSGLSELTGYSLDELIGMNGVDLVAPEYRPVVMEKIISGYPDAYDVIGLKKDGSRFNLEVRGKSFQTEGKTQRVTEFRDISERKRAEEKIREQNSRLASIAQSLRKKNEQLEEFTQIVSHNLRSPVGNISALLEHYENTNDAEEKAELVRYLKSASDSLLATMLELNEILKVSQAGPLEAVVLDFSQMLEKVTMMLHSNIVSQKALLETNFEIKKIKYSSLYLESILLNLLSNALKYASPQRPPVIRISTFEKEGKTILRVEDNGLGIDLEKFGHQIFKLRKTFHNHPDSRGVGLFMVKNQVEAMGGEIQVTSEVEKGTTFTIYFGKHFKNE